MIDCIASPLFFLLLQWGRDQLIAEMLLLLFLERHRNRFNGAAIS